MIGIDLFSGAGGMSLGANLAGIDVRLAVESDPWAARTYALNFPKTRVFQGDIALVTAKDLPSTHQPRVLFGGPPCQGFSTSNQKDRSSANPRNWLFQEFLRVVRIWEPDWVIFENVKGIIETEGGIFLQRAVQGLGAAGYTVNYRVLNALEFGVPQRRQRVFVVGSRHGIWYEFPRKGKGKPITVKQAVGDLPELDNGASFDSLPYRSRRPSAYALLMRGEADATTGHLVTRNGEEIIARYKHVPEGGNWESIPLSLMRNYSDRSRCHTGIYYRLQRDAPSIVIGNYRKNMLIHPTEHRGLSVREAARIQSFPDWFTFTGSIGFQQQQVGNAVPPLMARAVFAELVLQHYKNMDKRGHERINRN